MSKQVRVLWVDDEGDAGRMETRFDDLLELGVSVTPCLGAQDFMDRLRAGELDCDAVVMDLIMPPRGLFPASETANGLETGLRLIQELRRVREDFPVVVVTIRNRDGLSDALRALGVDEPLPKSSELSTIADAIKRAAEKR